MIGPDWVYRYVSPGLARLLGRPASELVGLVTWEVSPQAAGTPGHAEQERAMRERRASLTTWQAPGHQVWYDVRTLPTADGMLVLADDVTERERQASRAERLVEVGEALAATTDAHGRQPGRRRRRCCP